MTAARERPPNRRFSDLSNAALIAEFDAAYAAYCCNPSAEARLKIFGDEIRRREAAGTLGDEDWDAALVCNECQERLADIRLGPMLYDHVWIQLAAKHERLCFGCMLERATQRNVHLDLSSLSPCAFNLYRWPRSYFNLFAEIETPPTRLSPEWREAWHEFKSDGDE
jgi:hypothetical protein